MSSITANICSFGLNIAIFNAVYPDEVKTKSNLATSSKVAKIAHLAIVFYISLLSLS